jgi:ABC-type nitrate/sulfonate/bicarbonate transport system substrate-binding protein
MRTAAGRWIISAILFTVTMTAAIPARPAQRTELRVAVNTTTIESFPAFLAAESSSGGDARVVIVPVANGRIAMSQLVSGAVDAATGSETQVLLNSVAEPRLRIVVTLADCRYRIVARRASGITRLADLRGKRVGATLNTSSQYYLAGMLRKAGLRESDTQFVNLEGQDMAEALKKNAVDAVSIWEPHAQNSLEALGKEAVVFQDAGVYREQFNLNTRADVLADPARRMALARFLQAIDAASNRLRRRPADLIPTLAPRIGMNERTVMAVWPQFRFPAALEGGLQSSMSAVEGWVATMQNRQPRTPAQLASLVDGTVLAQARKLSKY